MVETDELSAAKQLLQAEAGAITAAADRLDDRFVQAVGRLTQARAVHVSGVGKSGHIAQKIAGTLRSTGTEAHFLHPTEALHGDLGNVQGSDATVLISRSGECEETLALMRQLHGMGVSVVAITGDTSSTLAQGAAVVLDCSTDEACPDGLVPTSSTTASLAMGDALANAVRARKGHTAEDFRRTHPGGALGKR